MWLDGLLNGDAINILSGLKGLYSVLSWCTFNALINITGNY